MRGLAFIDPFHPQSPFVSFASIERTPHMTLSKSDKTPEWLSRLLGWHGWVTFCIVVVAVGVCSGAFFILKQDRAPISRPELRAIHSSGTELQNAAVPSLPLSQMDRFESITFTNLNGKRVIRMRLVAGGDEVIVDSVTGKLLEVKEGPGASIPSTNPKRQALPIPVPAIAIE
jgi:hypothetical protein